MQQGWYQQSFQANQLSPVVKIALNSNDNFSTCEALNIMAFWLMSPSIDLIVLKAQITFMIGSARTSALKTQIQHFFYIAGEI